VGAEAVDLKYIAGGVLLALMIALVAFQIGDFHKALAAKERADAWRLGFGVVLFIGALVWFIADLSD